MDGQIRHLSTANIVLMHSITQVMNDQRKKQSVRCIIVLQ